MATVVKVLAPDRLTSIIDALGDASFRAQGLPGPVTTARKFRISDHRLYLVKNSSDHNNLGSVVGFLKVGAKNLFVHDSHGQVHERTPLCLLDFFVHESKQRSGYGKQLFEAMLEFEKCNAYELAIDRPSNKCLGFLHKHYSLSSPVRQVNNFVVFGAFFNRSPINLNRKLSASKQRNETSLPNDLYRRQESTPWLLPSEKQQQNRRPLTEHSEFNRNNNRLKILSDENEMFNNRQQVPIMGNPLFNNERKPASAFPTPYGHRYTQNALTREPNKTNEISHSAPYMPRHQAEVFNENNPFPSLQRYNTNPVMSSNKQSTANPQQNFTYKEYQSSSTVSAPPQRNFEIPSKSESLTSIYTFPSLVKTNANWRRPQQQQTTYDGSSSSTWRLFGVHRLLN
ncbi:unnamed protein product [Rotaria socialis]|uniref:Alpha-tubulin N-acetyltransferase n=2 Tax=Rotaria socialis TaxID=392032 RepID=A0A821ASU4_9BILA|nr:unnamed protein product [Rotaria socialis]CAF4563949.1 unnamed protein product [Rotaria socialis]CAF4568041.1 unnamed protein product [Rotaria socialis]CAF4585346.1 unnamed protein product [Rotaria socialis]